MMRCVITLSRDWAGMSRRCTEHGSWAVVVALTLANAVMSDTGEVGGLVPDGSVVAPEGDYYRALGVSEERRELDGLTYEFRGLEHRAPWCVFLVMLDESVDLTRGEVRLHFGGVSDEVSVKLEVRDTRYQRQRSAHKRIRLEEGEGAVVRVRKEGLLLGLSPVGWQRLSLWPEWQSVQYVGLAIEARYNRVAEGSVRLDRIEYAPDGGEPRVLRLWSDRVFCYEYEPAAGLRPDIADGGGVGAAAPTYEPDQPEVTVGVKRDDPSTALFLSGSGYKLELDPLAGAVGISAQVSMREEAFPTDGLLIQAARRLRSPERDPTRSDADIQRDALTDPVWVRGVLGSVVFNSPDPAHSGWPRLTFTYEDVWVESDSSIQLDFRQQIHEFAALWSTPYLDDGRRWRATFEPAYQYWRVTSDTDSFARLDRHRGLLGVVVHDEWAQREFFVLGWYGKSNHKDVDADEAEHRVQAEWRQWYGRERLGFSTLGVSFTETDFQIEGRRDDQLREFKAYGSLIVELDERGRWRWLNEVIYNRTTADILIFFPTSQRGNEAFEFWLLQSRMTWEAVSDVDVSVGFEHAVADEHSYDSVAAVGRVSFFNVGPFRGELGARHTWYYNLDDDLSTLFLQINFAR